MEKPKTDPFMYDDDNPPLTPEQIRELRPTLDILAELGVPMPKGRPRIEQPKKQVTLRLDQAVIEHFKRDGKGWQTRLNDTLAAAIKDK